MARTDDFTLETKKNLARRAGFHCSFLGCNAMTIGPSDEHPEATSDTGMACHIAAASGGPAARRYDASMTGEARKSIANGIWCCYTHGKLIDTDETRFTVKMLENWKAIAEKRAQIMQEKQCCFEESKRYFAFKELIAATITLGKELADGEHIGRLLHDCGAEFSWGAEITHAVRDLLIELARNAVTHGQANAVNLTIMDTQMTLADDGASFNPKRGLLDGAGGSFAAMAIKELQPLGLLWTYYREHEQNFTKISYLRTAADVATLTPCSITIPRPSLYRGDVEIEFTAHCNDVYVVVPQYLVYSDIYGLTKALNGREFKDKTVTIITEHISRGVIAYIKKHIPGAEVVGLNRSPHPFSDYTS